MKTMAKRIILVLLAALIGTSSIYESALALSDNERESVERNAPYHIIEPPCTETGAVGGAGAELDGFKLPATHGFTGNEEPINESGQVPSTGGRVTFAGHATNNAHGDGGKAFRDYYMTMRWTYAAWFWNGSSNIVDNKQISWMQQKPRLVLVSNPRTKKSIIAAVLESGPAPWTGVDTMPNNTPKFGWQQPQIGTPDDSAGYKGRVSGFPPAAMQALEAVMGQKNGAIGDDLRYSWAGDQNAKPGPVPYVDQGGAAAPSGGTSTGSSSGCPGGGGTGVSPDGFVFPLRTSKNQLGREGNAYWSPKCTNPIQRMGSLGTVEKRNDLCHHTYLAADIQQPTGTPVLAPRPGRIIRAGDGGSVGHNVSIYSDPALGGDGNTYYEAHMGGLSVALNQTVKAGDTIGLVGTSADAQGTLPHLHIDASPIQEGFGRNYDGTHGPLLDMQPALTAAYNNLPEN